MRHETREAMACGTCARRGPQSAGAGGVVTSKGGRSGRRKEGTGGASEEGAEVMGGEVLSVHDMNEPCSVTEA